MCSVPCVGVRHYHGEDGGLGETRGVLGLTPGGQVRGTQIGEGGGPQIGGGVTPGGGDSRSLPLFVAASGGWDWVV